MKNRHSGLGMPPLVLAGLLFVQLAAVAQPNAWQITDNSTAAGSTLSYTNQLNPANQMAASNAGFRFTINARSVDDFGGSQTMAMSYGLGTRRFLIWWDLDSNGNLTSELEGGITYTLTTNGTGSALYHTHEIVYNPTNQTASYLVGGQVKTNNWPGSAVASPAGRIAWGAGSSGGQGRMNFNAVTFAINGLGTVAGYDAGTAGNPPVAPDPAVQGWTLAPSIPPANMGVTNVSPDAVLPVATTQAADQFTTNSARLNGRVNPQGWPTVAWFEWGTDTNYGNVIGMQDVGQGSSASNLNAVLDGLMGGPTYHYRLVASNAFGLVTGTDQFINISFVRRIIPGLQDRIGGSLAAGDYDNDGLLDFLIAGGVGVVPVSELWRNTGDGFVQVNIPGLPDVYLGTFLAWGDYDNDGRLDFLISGATTNINVDFDTELWRNTGSGFVNVPTIGLPGLRQGSAAWGDYDNDGRLDLLISGSADSLSGGFPVIQLWRNYGGGLVHVTVADLPPRRSSDWIAWGDYDNDGLLDFVTPNSSSPLWRNTGSGFTNATATALPGLPIATSIHAAWGDYNHDGWLDLLLNGQLWRNTGGVFTNVTASVGGGTISGQWGDYDNDGRLDLLSSGGVLRNTGDGFVHVPISGMSISGSGLVAWGDYDNDGRLDFLAGTNLWRNNMPVSNTPPVAPTGLSAAFAGPYVALSWNPASDAQTPAAGLTYNLRIGTAPGGSEISSPMSLPNGRRLLPQMGNAQLGTTALLTPQPGQTYYWSVQAVDTAFAGSPFSVERSFTVAPYFALTDGTPVFGDSNGDRVVDQNELNTVLNNYWQTSPPNMESVISPSNTVFQFGLTNLSSLNFRVLASTNVALPLMDWTDIGPASLFYKFTDPDATNYPARFYQLVWP